MTMVILYLHQVEGGNELEVLLDVAKPLPFILTEVVLLRVGACVCVGGGGGGGGEGECVVCEIGACVCVCGVCVVCESECVCGVRVGVWSVSMFVPSILRDQTS